ncbi:hypothetical protein HRbin11_01555 [bacterium HR11]|nr:hypothetical protein HRbin11_01555 [bacterium HR11]
MWRLSGWLFLPVFVVTACTHTLQTDPTRPETLPALQRRLDGKDLKVLRTDGTEVRVPKARVTAEGVGGISWSEIRAVEHRSRSRGALEGLRIGAGLGLAGAIALGAMAATSPCNPPSWFCSDRPEKNFLGYFLVGSILFVPLGSGLGLLVGAVKGSKTRVVVSQEGRRSQE